MDAALLTPPFDPAALAAASTASLKSSLLKQVEGRDGDPMGKKVRFANEILMPLFDELARRNPTPDLTQQIPLLQGIWISHWSTNPFQDILPGRVHSESYQIFDDSGYYANLARYKPGRKAPLLSWLSRWLLSYDLLIMQSYVVRSQPPNDPDQPSAPGPDYWDIQNVCIQQSLRLGSRAFSPGTAQDWFDQAVAKYQQQPGAAAQAQSPTAQANATRITSKQYQQIAKARPQLDNLYIDESFRLVKTQREKSQRPSYTVAVRLDQV